jgi:hypothetical protein
MIARDGPTVSQLSDHPMEVDLAPTQHDHHIAGVILRILKPEPDHRRLTILLFQRLKLKTIRIRDISLRVVRYSLFVRHV